MSVVVLLVVIAAVVSVPLVLLARRRPARSGASSPTEFLIYLILAGATLLATGAFSTLVEMILPGGRVLTRQPDELALSLATLLVAGIVATVVWMTLEKVEVGGERPARALYISLVTGVSMVTVAVVTVMLGRWIFGEPGFPTAAAADLIAFGGIWWLHELVRRRGVAFDDLRALVGSGVGLVLSVGGLGVVLVTSLEAAFGSGSVIIGGENTWEGLIDGLVMLAVGVPYLWWFWLRPEVKATSWRVPYAAVVALISWLVAVVAFGQTVYTLLAAGFGLEQGRLDNRLPGLLTVLLVGGVTYWHHREELGRERTVPVMLIEYAFSAVGFLTGAGALVTLVATVINNLFEQALLGTNTRLLLGAGVALAVAGGVLARYWWPAQRRAGEAREQRALPRRVAIVGLLTVFSLAGLGGLIAVLFVLLRSALGGTGDFREVLSWAVPLVVISGGLAWYFADLRPRRPEGAPAAPAAIAGVSVVTLVAADPGPLPKMLDGMRLLHRSDGRGTVDEARAEAIKSALASLEARAALVVVDEESFQAIPLT
ncbi:MAG TPA: DUF5671 domain-containing protein [Acidimicrobiia bacterium]|nr:DUF5671 domain-containing protein [Acidimicrobiia bacterium]